MDRKPLNPKEARDLISNLKDLRENPRQPIPRNTHVAQLATQRIRRVSDGDGVGQQQKGSITLKASEVRGLLCHVGKVDVTEQQ